MEAIPLPDGEKSLGVSRYTGGVKLDPTNLRVSLWSEDYVCEIRERWIKEKNKHDQT